MRSSRLRHERSKVIDFSTSSPKKSCSVIVLILSFKFAVSAAVMSRIMEIISKKKRGPPWNTSSRNVRFSLTLFLKSESQELKRSSSNQLKFSTAWFCPWGQDLVTSNRCKIVKEINLGVCHLTWIQNIIGRLDQIKDLVHPVGMATSLDLRDQMSNFEVLGERTGTHCFSCH